MNMYSVSVVIPVRNRPGAIVRAIESVFSQSVTVLEVIVVDDASTDNTVSIVENLAKLEPRIRLIALRENRGGGFARNVGIDAANGDLIAFLDSDDFWLPGKLEKQLALIEGSSDVLCFCNLKVDHGDGTPSTAWNTEAWSVDQSAKNYILDLDQVIQTSTWLMSTELARRIRFDGSLRRHQDIDFVLRADKMGIKFIYSTDILVNYNADPKTVRTSQRKNAKPSLDWMQVASAYLNDREISKFYLKHIAEIEISDAPMRAIWRMICCARKGHFGYIDSSRVLSRSLIPKPIKELVKSIVRRGN